MKRLFINFLLIMCMSSSFAQLPENYSSETLSGTYTAPMGTIFNSDGSKMFVWTNAGQIYVSNWNGTNYVKQSAAVLDLSDEISGYRDFGLLSICLDPNFDINGLIYLFYTVDRHHLLYFGTPQYNPNTNDYYKASISRVTRYMLNHTQSPMTTDYSTRTILLGESITTGIPLTHESHAGGTLMFGSDGTLLLTTGDNASYSTTDTGSVSHTYYQQAIADGIMRPEENVGSFRSQMINSLCGKLLRLDPATGDGVPSNPFYDANNPRAPKSRMFAMGFRNPFRAAIKPNSGSTDPADANPGMVFVADVGWNNWEDLHIIDKPGLNAGWPLYEGQTLLSSYYNSGTTNPDEGNQLFKNLCAQPTSFVDAAIPANRRYTHHRPAITWKHGTSLQTRVPWFNGNNPTDPRIGANGSPTTGDEFRGNTGVAGTYISGTAFGEAMEGKFLFTDYVRNWVGVATLNATNAPWISHTSTFAPINYGSGIVHMSQNPMDGSIFYTNIFDGTIRRFSFYDETLEVDEEDITNIVFYPNPVLNELYISGLDQEYQLDIYSISGQHLLTKKLVGDSKIPLSLSSGIYVAKLIASSSGQSTVRQIVVE
ncbi:MAG: PQQ-dependent sugar dehydrogenase [Gelidibacter sp.]|nr:PQQ-dependent sugar dehydrogenase [Gelidibacter sp.]